MSIMIDREQLVEDLRAGVVEVHFNKADGSNRVMRATLSPRLMPPSMKSADISDAHEYRKTNPGVVAVWDLTANGWRAFRLDSVTYLQGVSSD